MKPELRSVFIFATLLFMLLTIGCEEPKEDEISNRIGLPTAFPLEVGNAWIYERHYYESDEDSVELDTLYISGKYGDYYKYTWRPNDYASLVKNVDGMLINYGHINVGEFPDTSIFEVPNIWAFFNGDTGFVDFADYSDYRAPGNTLHVGIKENIQAFGNVYRAYVASTIDTLQMVTTQEQLMTQTGFYQWTYYMNTGEKYYEGIMIKQLKNFLPKPSMQKKGQSTRSKPSGGFQDAFGEQGRYRTPQSEEIEVTFL